MLAIWFWVACIFGVIYLCAVAPVIEDGEEPESGAGLSLAEAQALLSVAQLERMFPY